MIGYYKYIKSDNGFQTHYKAREIIPAYREINEARDEEIRLRKNVAWAMFSHSHDAVCMARLRQRVAMYKLTNLVWA